MSAHDLLACAVSAWYPTFKGVAFKTALIPLPQEFVDYLVADGVHVPADTEAFAQPGADPCASDDDWSSSSSCGDADGQQAPEFPGLVAQIRSAIAELGGVVAPKFTWSCPKDALWLTLGHTLACRSPGEVLLLLKGSDRVAHDICHALEGCAPDAGTEADTSASRGSTPAAGGGDAATAAAAAVAAGAAGAVASGTAAGAGGATGAHAGPTAVQHVLALRRWHDLRPEREFRCFVRDHQLVGVSQREVTEFYPSLVEEQQQIQQRIEGFHRQHIQGKFSLPHYTYDVYVAATAEAVKLLDFNPIGGTTAPLLFEWGELPFRDLLGQQQQQEQQQEQQEQQRQQQQEQQRQQQQQQQLEEHEEGSRKGARSSTVVGEGAAAAQGSGSGGEGSAQQAQLQQDLGAGAVSIAAISAEDSYLQQLRQVRALSLQDPQCEGSPTDSAEPSNACCGCHSAAGGGGASAPTTAADAAGHQAQHGEAPREAGSSSGSGRSGAAAFEFRILAGPVAMRPNKLAYGVPFDFVDASEGSALDNLMKQLGGQGGPEELWAALRSQAA